MRTYYSGVVVTEQDRANWDSNSTTVLTITGDTTMSVPVDTIDGSKREWRISAYNIDCTVAWPSGGFKIPSSSSMTYTVTVSANTESIFVSEYNLNRDKWLMVAYIYGY